MAEQVYQFHAEKDIERLNAESSKGIMSNICNIIDGFPSDYGEQVALVYGRLRGLFGEPLYEEEDTENQYSYCIIATAEDGKEIVLDAYSGPSGPAIGGHHDEESRAAAAQLVKYIQQAVPADYEYEGYYMDGPTRIRQGVKNGVPYFEEEELSDEEMEELFTD